MQTESITAQRKSGKPKIICFGDSNTFGNQGFSGGRYDISQRWTGILSKDPAISEKYEVINMGENGREIPDDPWEMDYTCRQMMDLGRPALIVIMLGTNDLMTMYRSGMPKIVSRMELFTRHLVAYDPGMDEKYLSLAKTEGRPAPGPLDGLIFGDPSRILLVAPVPTQLCRYGDQAAMFDEISNEFAVAYYRLARKYGMHYANADDWDVELGTDGVHFTEEGHAAFARGIAGEIKEILGIWD